MHFLRCSRPHPTFKPSRWTRGKRTSTKAQLKDLPQGALEPLPPDVAERSPSKEYPAVLQQHLNNMRKFSSCVLLTRIGDFYELYFEHAEQYGPLLNLKVASRRTNLGPVPMAGFQQTQLDRYLKMLVLDLGKQAAISEQVARANETEIIAGGPRFDRKVTRIVTAGTLIDESFVEPFECNYLLAVHLEDTTSDHIPESVLNARLTPRRDIKIGLSWVDLSSGDFFTQLSNAESLPSLVARIRPREIVLDSRLEHTGRVELYKLLGEGSYSLHFHAASHPRASVAEWADMLERPVPDEDQRLLSGEEIGAGSLVLDYVHHKLPHARILLQPPKRRSEEEYMSIDKQSLKGLEIRSTLRDNMFQGSLLHTIRSTVTKSGARLLSQRLVSPAMSPLIINRRLDLVEEMLRYDALKEDVTALLRQTSDTLRLLQRFSINKGDADDLLGLAKTIAVMNQVSTALDRHLVERQAAGADMTFLKENLARLELESPVKVARAILDAVDEEGLSRQHTMEVEKRAESEGMAEEVEVADATGEKPPKLAVRASRSKASSVAAASAAGDIGDEDIWIMRRSASPTLSHAHGELDQVLAERQSLAAELRQNTGANTLVLKWSSQHGHHCHVKGKDARLSLLAGSPTQTITSTKSTRTFYSPDWSRLGRKIDDAKLRIRTEEERVFNKLRGLVLENLMRLRRSAHVLDEVDVACSSAVVARNHGWVRPILHEGTSHQIIGGRHPTVDVGLHESGRRFVANDCSVGSRGVKIYMITGPNMAGKSTYLRQNALITILAQTGSYVPADYAEIGIVDKIFSRVGSADNLYEDQSTFMVEMLETAEILKSATARSFVIMDEVGRGTTPEDGIAVGYACLHHLHNVNQCRTLFATHFHSLSDMTAGYDGLQRWCTDVEEEADGSWAYVHKLREGVNRQSHALKVARLAGMPLAALDVAENALRNFGNPNANAPLNPTCS